MKRPEDYTDEDWLASRWIERIRIGDPHGLDSLYALYHRPILSLISGILNDRGTAEEILQDVFIRVFEKAGLFDPELGTPFTWLATIAKRKALDRLRRQRHRKKILSEQREHPADFDDKGILDESASAQNEFDKLWMGELLSTVSEAQREVIDLAFLQGYTHIEISKALNKPLGTVKSDLRRGMFELRKHCLGEND